MCPLLREIVADCRKPSFSRGFLESPVIILTYVLAEKPWALHVSNEYKDDNRGKPFTNGPAFLKSTLRDMWMDSRDSVHSINLLYRRKEKGRQEVSPGHKVLINVRLPTPEEASQIKGTQLRAARASVAASEVLCGFLYDLQLVRLCRTRQRVL